VADSHNASRTWAVTEALHRDKAERVFPEADRLLLANHADPPSHEGSATRLTVSYSDNMVILETNDLTRRFGDVVAVDH
jgi:hypothetical protein